MNLLIDTHLNDIVIILTQDNIIIRQEKIENEKQNSKFIMPTIKKILDGIIPESIIVVNGPGSFTGVRLGVTIAKTFAHVLNIPIYTVTSLECMAISIKDGDRIVGFSDNNGYYIGIFNEDLELIGNYEYLTNNEFKEYNENHNVVTHVVIDYVKVIEFASSKKRLNPHEVNPIYIKKLDVEK